MRDTDDAPRPRRRAAAPAGTAKRTRPTSMPGHLADDAGGTAPTARGTLTPDTRPAAQHIAAIGGTGYLTPDDIPGLSAAERRAYAALADGQPHHAADIIRAVGGYDAMRRARALRGRRAHIDGRDVLLSLTCRRGPGMAGMYTLTTHPAPDVDADATPRRTHRKP